MHQLRKTIYHVTKMCTSVFVEHANRLGHDMENVFDNRVAQPNSANSYYFYSKLKILAIRVIVVRL